MAVIHSTLNNFSTCDQIILELNKYGDNLCLTTDLTMRYVNKMNCPLCGKKMVHNGRNKHGRTKIGMMKTQRYFCKKCNHHEEVDSNVITSLVNEFIDALRHMILIMRVGYLSFDLIAQALSPIIKISADTVENIIKHTVDSIELPNTTEIFIVHYDEQHPKKGRIQKYRLALLDNKTKNMIAELLTDELNSDVIKEFLDKYLPHDKIIFVVTDLAKIYNEILEEIRPGFIIHQHCLLHLNKLLVKDFGRYCSFEEEYIKYELLNIFYDRLDELEYLKEVVIKEKIYLSKNGDTGYFKWLKNEKRNFHQFLRTIEKTRRKALKKLGLPNRMKMWTLDESINNFSKLMMKREKYPEEIKKRLDMIKQDWKKLSAFYHIENAPATNNLIENYFSCSCKQIKKKQHRRTSALIRQWKLYALYRLGLLTFTNRKFNHIITLIKMLDGAS
jgi:transposase-like protein